MGDDLDAYLEQEFEDRINGGLDVADPDPDPMDDGGDWDDIAPEDCPEECPGDCAECRAIEDCEAAGGYPDWPEDR